MAERQQMGMQMLRHQLSNWRGSPGQLGFTEQQKELLQALELSRTQMQAESEAIKEKMKETLE